MALDDYKFRPLGTEASDVRRLDHVGSSDASPRPARVRRSFNDVGRLLTAIRDDVAKGESFTHPQGIAASYGVGEIAMGCVLDAAKDVSGIDFRGRDEGACDSACESWLNGDDDREDDEPAADALRVMNRALEIAIERTCDACKVVGGGLHLTDCAAMAADEAQHQARLELIRARAKGGA